MQKFSTAEIKRQKQGACRNFGFERKRESKVFGFLKSLWNLLRIAVKI
jgi:hypothetical protein